MEGEDTRLYPESELKTEHFTNRAAMLGSIGQPPTLWQGSSTDPAP